MPNQHTYPKLTDAQWQRIEPLIPRRQKFGSRGKPPICRRKIINAILYRFHRQVPWRMLPSHFPRPETVRWLYHAWQRDGTWDQILGIVNESEVKCWAEIQADAKNAED